MIRKVLAAVTDLFFVAKIRAAARQAGVELDFVKSPDELVEKARGVELLVVDLNDATLDSLELLRQIRSRPETASVRALAFFSHVDVDLGRQARRAGFDRVLPRSQFSSQLVDLLRD